MKKSESKFIGIREIVVVTLFSVLTFLVSMLTAMPFAASVHLQLYVGYALMSIISGACVLLITHDAELIYHCADHVYKMYRPRSYQLGLVSTRPSAENCSVGCILTLSGNF